MNLGSPPCEVPIDEIVEKFADYLLVDEQLAELTIRKHCSYIKKFLLEVNKPVEMITTNDIRQFLKCTENAKCHYYKVVRVFFGRFLRRKELIETFKVPQNVIKPKIVPTKKELQSFYESLENIKEKTMFLLLASSGLRVHELLELDLKDIDLEKRMILPKSNNSRTKRTWITLFNSEANELLIQYIKEREIKEGRLFSNSQLLKVKIFKHQKNLETRITAKMLREWFACELGRLGVPDRYVDAFCGRVPRSILARHYTDYSPERLKEIYDKAGLKVLAN